nr:alpha/beta hydrolase [Kibdelosporangium sp. MJ126-NF4]CEL21633.1 probable hydrolase [Kibdelosporangium sp. MJ126-NF4]CTQ92414.1 probable hydrolase [Kibdelosporangium sp. MJ126-NF4]
MVAESLVVDGDVRLSTRLRESGADLIVFLHGIGCAKESFADAFDVPALAGYSLCAFDLPGHGESSRMSDYSLPSYADVTVQAVNALAAKRVFVVGHSMGGAVGLLAAARLTNLAGFVNVEGNLVADDCGLVSRKTARTGFDTFTSRGFHRFAEKLRTSPRKDVRAWAQWYPLCDPVAIHRMSGSLVEWSDGGSMLEMFLAMPNVSYVYGGDAARVGYVLPLLADVPTYAIPDAGHFPMVDNPSGFYATVADVIA